MGGRDHNIDESVIESFLHELDSVISSLLLLKTHSVSRFKSSPSSALTDVKNAETHNTPCGNP